MFKYLKKQEKLKYLIILNVQIFEEKLKYLNIESTNFFAPKKVY
jgi:hypothetical protein